MTGKPKNPTRRDFLRAAGVSLLAAGSLDLATGRGVHALVQQEATGADGYTPKLFNSHELATIRRLSELIVPKDDVSGSAADAGAPEFMDLLASENDRLARTLVGGVHWLDREMDRRGGAVFAEASSEAQALMLDDLAEATQSPATEQGMTYDAVEYRRFEDYTATPGSPLRGGVRFFGWVRRLTVDAFYTSEIGYADVGYEGNRFLRQYRTPKAAIDFAVSRSPFADEE